VRTHLPRAAALGLLLLGLACARGGCARTPASPPPPPPGTAPAAGNPLNVLLITIDTLRADHLGLYGYRRPTSPHLDAFARQAVTFDQAYTYWPKTRGSFVALLTGRRDSQTGYGKAHQELLGFNETLAGVLKKSGYATAAVVDNANLAVANGYAKGFDIYRETWLEPALATEMDKTRAITAAGVEFLGRAPGPRPFFLWLHYVNPHAPYTPPAPWDTAFMDEEARSGPALPVVAAFHGGIPRQWAVAGQRRLGYYVAQYDGEIATVDAEVGKVLEALRGSPSWERTLVVVTSDHGESLGEHGYYFDHGEDLFDPGLRVPLLLRLPGGPAGARRDVLASTLDIVPTVLDALKVSYPPDLAGASLLAAAGGGPPPPRDRLFARNDRSLSAGFDRRFKTVAVPADDGPPLWALYDRQADPAETKDASARQPQEARRWRRELELYQERSDREREKARALAGEAPPAAPLSPEACANLKALGYADARCPN
jgi:arylsulfatase A-like enzyme